MFHSGMLVRGKIVSPYQRGERHHRFEGKPGMNGFLKVVLKPSRILEQLK
jgi:hypothetical protein